MIVTIIPEDRTIVCDGVAVVLKPWPFDDSSFHAIQWRHTEGEIEHKVFPRIANTVIDDYSIVAPYVEAFNAAQAQSEQNP